MNILLVTPAARGTLGGNRVTALRWAGHLRALGHRVSMAQTWAGDPGPDVLVALHATRSAPSVSAFHAAHPGRPIVLALTGTDLYEERLASDEAQRSVALATRVVVLQDAATSAVPAPSRDRVRVIVQSAHRVAPAPRPAGTVQVALLAHVRPVKDPLLAAAAVRLLPRASRVRVVHVGEALDPALSAQARRAAAEDDRYAWAGPRRRRAALALLASSDALLVTSRTEGGANVVSEAVAAGVPVLSTAIDGTIGLLGATYPGYFPAGDAPALAALLARFERDGAFRATLGAAIARVRPLVAPERERAAWKALLDEITAPGPAGRGR